MFTDEAQPMPNTTTEKLMPMYLLERRRDPEATTYDVKTHEGPTLTLVKTALFAGTTSTGTWPTSTFSWDRDYNVHKSSFKPGAIIGVVLGIAFVMIGLVCLARMNGKPRPMAAALARSTEEGEGRQVEHRATGGPAARAETGRGAQQQQSSAEGSGGVDRDEEETLPPYTKEQPPKYTP